MNRVPCLVSIMLVLLAGCSSPTPGPVTNNDCFGVELAGECSTIADLKIDFSGCMETRLGIDLDRAVYELPHGYSNRPSTLAPQRLPFAISTCSNMTVGSVVEHSVSILQLGVLVEADEPGPAEADVLILETGTSSMLLRSILLAAGIPTVMVTVEAAVDSSVARQMSARGDVDYVATSAFPPLGDGTLVSSPVIEHSEAHHGSQFLYVEKIACTEYFGYDEVLVDAQKGTLVEAKPLNGVLQGRSAQSVMCDLSFHFKER